MLLKGITIYLNIRLDIDGNGYLEVDDFKKLMGEEFDEEVFTLSFIIRK